MTTTQALPPVRVNSPLTLTGILASALPKDLGTARAPSRYVVPVVFSRRPEPRELDLLQGSSISRRLDEAGYSDVELRVSDRRLLITNTNLVDLKSGLAQLLGIILNEVTTRRTGNGQNGQRNLMPSALSRNSGWKPSGGPPRKSTSTEARSMQGSDPRH
ncbi:hypothetical protein QFZ70_000334 [Arthrobacter sp. V1I9]|uniref:hypothetical protein n=1 Tax=Arthrobacter sp. V1I9 TaxID=3042275 RepID=UPI00278FB457|nr:hypothetical protein [Arthrobacter sp. V1I9]MDQ0867861.1 hypothetical protein [Arthrobacter sp. V1I9]